MPGGGGAPGMLGFKSHHLASMYLSFLLRTVGIKPCLTLRGAVRIQGVDGHVPHTWSLPKTGSCASICFV